MLAFFMLLSICPLVSFAFPPVLTLFTFLVFSELTLGVQPATFSIFNDETATLMVYMTVFVLFSAYLFTPRTTQAGGVMLALLGACCGVFLSLSPLAVYFFYEASLFPILYVILKWGMYPERSLSSIMLLTYTAIFTLPFLSVLSLDFSQNLSLFSFTLSGLPHVSPSSLVSTVVLLCFCVKLPIYGVHFWLPMAHVEAPTFGSMVLAGVLLKLGGVGLIRFAGLLSFHGMRTTLLSYFLVGLIIATVVCCVQSDFKRIIAYSSVSHMMCIPPLMLIDSGTSVSTATLVMLTHGLSSPLLFMLVGCVYSVFSTRQLVLARGAVLVSPVLASLAVFSFLFSLAAPPFPSFIAEIFFILSCLAFSQAFMPVVFLFCFLSLLYGLGWLSSILFSSSPSTVFTITFSSVMPMVLSILGSGALGLLFTTMW